MFTECCIHWCQVDASQGSEEMVEHLSEKVLQQEEQIQQLEEEKNDLASSLCLCTCCASLYSRGFYTQQQLLL